MADSDITRIHERLDNLFEQQSQTLIAIEGIEERCKPCRRLIHKHEELLYGNGKSGLVVEIAKLRQGRGDTVTVKSVCALIGAITALIATVIGTAMVH